MAFDHSHVDARNSTFNQAGRDFHQTVNNGTIHHLTIHINNCSSTSRQTDYHPSLSINRTLEPQISVPQALFQRDFPVTIRFSVPFL
jgi:hypothetical protein